MQHHPNATGASVIPTVRYRNVAAAVAWLQRGIQFRAASPGQGCERRRALRRTHVRHRHGDGGSDPGVPARQPDGAARRDRRRRNANLLSVRGQRARRTTPAPRRRAPRSCWTSRSRPPAVADIPVAISKDTCGISAPTIPGTSKLRPAVARGRAAPGRSSPRACCSRSPAPSICTNLRATWRADLALTILRQGLNLDRARAGRADAGSSRRRRRAARHARPAFQRTPRPRRRRPAGQRHSRTAGAGAPWPRGCRACSQEYRRGSDAEPVLPGPSHAALKVAETAAAEARSELAKVRSALAAAAPSSLPRPRRPSRLPNRAPKDAREQFAQLRNARETADNTQPASCASWLRASAVRASRRSAR